MFDCMVKLCHATLVVITTLAPLQSVADNAPLRGPLGCRAITAEEGLRLCAERFTGTGIVLVASRLEYAKGTVLLELPTFAHSSGVFMTATMQRELTVHRSPLGRVAEVTGTLAGSPGWVDPLATGSATLCQPRGGARFFRCAHRAEGNGLARMLWLETQAGTPNEAEGDWVLHPGQPYRLCTLATPGPTATLHGPDSAALPLMPTAADEHPAPSPRCSAWVPAAQPTSAGGHALDVHADWADGEGRPLEPLRLRVPIRPPEPEAEG